MWGGVFCVALGVGSAGLDLGKGESEIMIYGCLVRVRYDTRHVAKMCKIPVRVF